LSDVPICTCPETYPSIKKTQAHDQRKRLMQFLMHRNDEYEAIRGQILLLDPLPTVNKAYSMIQRMKRQRQVTNTTAVSREVVACVNKANTLAEIESANALMARGSNRRDMRKPKLSKFCDHCQKPGHEKDQCFKIIGYPKWYDDLKGKRKPAGSKLAANIASHFDGQDTPLGENNTQGGVTRSQFDPSFIQVLAHEFAKLTKGVQSNSSKQDRQEWICPLCT